MTGPIHGDGFRLRPLSEPDVDYLVDLGASPEVEPFLSAVSPWTVDALQAQLEGAAAEPDSGSRLVVEVSDRGGWRSVGGLAYAVQNRRSRIASIHGVMLDPAVRGRGLGERAVRLLATHLIRELGYHRVQLEVYGFNDRGQRLFDRAGFVREGVKRKAYWRHDAWQDGVVFGLVEEDLARES